MNSASNRQFERMLAVVDIAIAIILVVLTLRLPSREVVDTSFDKAESIRRSAADQLRVLTHELDKLQVDEAKRIAQALADELSGASQILETQSINFKLILAVREGMQEVKEGVARTRRSFDGQQKNIRKMGEGLRNGSKLLRSLAEQLDGIASRQYPSNVKVDRFPPTVEYSPLWPKGKEMATEARQVAEGLLAAAVSIETAGKDLPALFKATDGAIQVLDGIRDQIDFLVANREAIEASTRRALGLTRTLTNLSKNLSGDLAERVQTQKVMLGELEASIDAAEEILPLVHHSTDQILLVARILGWLFILFSILHAIMLIRGRSPA